MNLLALLPILIPLATAVATLLLWRSLSVQRWVGLAGTVVQLAAALLLLQQVIARGLHVVQVGNWQAPFGITIVADLLGGVMVVLSSLIGLAVAVYSQSTIDRHREHFGFHPLLHILLMGVNGAFLTGDMFNLYVWFEVMLIASFVLIALGGERGQLEGGMKYVTLNLVSSAIFLSAVGVLYGVTGTLNMADLARVLPTIDQPALVATLSMLFLVAFGIKAAIFPLFFWLPASYHTPPVAVSAIFAGLLTKVGVYALIRTFTLLFNTDESVRLLILVIAGLTMLSGVLGAVAQSEVRRILSFHIVSQIGYMVMGLALFTPLAIAGAVFYIAHHIIVKTNLFLLSGLIERLGGSFELKKLGGLYAAYPWAGFLFLIPALSLAGIPPLSGFWAKLALVRAGIEADEYAIVAVAIVVSLLTLFSMMKIWNEAFWSNRYARGPVEAGAPRLTMVLPIVALALLTLLIGFIAEPVFTLAMMTAQQLLEPSIYINAVLGEGR